MSNVNEKNMGNAEKSSLAQRILSTLGTIEYLGAPPDLSVRLLSKVKDEKSSIEDIAQIVLCSPPMSALLLKLCNSAYYGRGAVIDSVSRAIVHLGLAAVIRFVYAMEMMGMFHGGKEIQGFNESAFWKCGLAGALLAQEIALIQGIDDAEPVFLAGLLRISAYSSYGNISRTCSPRHGRWPDGSASVSTGRVSPRAASTIEQSPFSSPCAGSCPMRSLPRFSPPPAATIVLKMRCSPGTSSDFRSIC